MLFTVPEILENIENYLEQELTIDGVLVAEHDRWGEKPWLIVRNKEWYTHTKYAIYVNQPPRMSNLSIGFGCIPHLPPTVYYSVSTHRLLDHAHITGKLTKSDLVPTGIGFDIHGVVIMRPGYKCYLESEAVMPLDDVDLGIQNSVTLAEIMDQPGKFKHKTIRVNGILIGNVSLKLFYMASLGASPQHIDDKNMLEKSIQIYDASFIRKLCSIIEPGIGTQFQYWYSSQIVGQVIDANDDRFPLAITKVQSSAIQDGPAIFHLIE